MTINQSKNKESNNHNKISDNIYIFDSLTNKLQKLEPIDKNHIKMYVCGPTVYDRPHIGNARSILIYDLFYRFFKYIFPKITYVRNITDVDDKINQAAKDREITISQLTKETTALFHKDIAYLGAISPDFEPRATDNIEQMIKIIEQLIANNNAYIANKHILFRVKSFADYGKLSNRKIDEMISGARVEIADYKEDPLDFVLWKPADLDDDKSSIFSSPWGEGRPGWHIECSAMSSRYLGSDFDIHGGGADLQFPHHENEIAQSRCFDKNSSYAKYWIHNGFLTVNGEKMSKSLKNFITVADLIKKNINGIIIRYLLLSTHYRKPLDFNIKSLIDSQKAIIKFYQALDFIDWKASSDVINILDFNFVDKKEFFNKYLEDEILLFLADDMNIAKIIALLHKLAKEIMQLRNLYKIQDVKSSINDFPQDLQEKSLKLLAMLDFIGLIDVNILYDYLVITSKIDYDLFVDTVISSKNNDNDIKSSINNNISTISEEEIIAKINQRNQARADKNWALSDAIRQELLSKSVVIEDGKDGTKWRYI